MPSRTKRRSSLPVLIACWILLAANQLRAAFSSVPLGGAGMLHYWLCLGTVRGSFDCLPQKNHGTECIGGSLVSRGEISVGELTSLLMYTVYVGSGLQMLTYGPLAALSPAPFAHASTHIPQIIFRKHAFPCRVMRLDGDSPDIHHAWSRCWDTYFRTP